jgi:hypothetical protein
VVRPGEPLRRLKLCLLQQIIVDALREHGPFPSVYQLGKHLADHDTRAVHRAACRLVELGIAKREGRAISLA